ncbi:MAG: tetratricopeptide repeat protein [Treponema sp.]
MAKHFLNKTKKIRPYKRAIISFFSLISLISFSFAEDLPTGVFSMQECRECLRRFYRFEAIDEKLLASSAEKLEGIIFSFLNARSPSGMDTLFRAYRGVRSERIEGFDPSVSRGSIRASKECSLDQASHVQDLWSLYLEHAYVISAIYDLGGMKDYSSLIERLKTKVELFMKAIEPNAKIYLKYADYLYLSLAQGNAKAVHALPILYRKVLLLDKNNKEALVKLASWYIFPANEKTANINGFIEEAENYIDELEEIDLFNACLWYSVYYMKNYNVNKGFDYLQRANKIFPRHVYVAHLWNNYKNGIFRM